VLDQVFEIVSNGVAVADIEDTERSRHGAGLGIGVAFDDEPFSIVERTQIRLLVLTKYASAFQQP